jgi:hypothetical protein
MTRKSPDTACLAGLGIRKIVEVKPVSIAMNPASYFRGAGTIEFSVVARFGRGLYWLEER